ncbi:MAG TPA: hypothetical protein V6D05_07605 [Stenomitos sp.]
MPTMHAQRLLAAASACGLLIALGMAVGCTPDPAPGTGPDHDAMVMPTAQPSPTSNASPGTSQQQEEGVSFQTQVVPLLRDNCAMCHGMDAAGGIAMFDSSSTPRYTTIKNNLDRIISEVSSGGMPRNGQRFTQSQVGLLQTWQTEGAPNN